MTTAYTTGQITLTNGSAVITGVGTGWEVALISGGLIAAEADGNTLLIESVDSDTQITSATKWSGATGTYNYALVRDTAWLQQLSLNSNTLARLITELEAGTIYKYDASGDLAGRSAYNDRAKGYSYLVSVGVTDAQLYVKASAASGDWSGPFAYGKGPAGPAPEIEFEAAITGAPGSSGSMAVTGSGTSEDPYEITFTVPAGQLGVNWRGAYSGATAYAARDGVLDNGSAWIALQATTGHAPPTLPTTANAYWSLLAAKGTDGTGTGDVVGPASSIADRIATFGGTSGKVIKDSGKSINDVVFGPAAAVTDGNVAVFDGTTGRLLKQQTKAQFKTWLAATALDVSFDNSTANLSGNPATVQAAINAIGNSGGKNDALFAIEIADLKGQRMGMAGGVADSFDDTTGIITGGIGGVDGNTLVMLHFDGANGSTTMTDSAFAGKTWTVAGDAKISTAQSKFGGASLLLDGAGDFLSRAYDSDFDMAGDFTIDCWIRTTVDSKMIYMKGGGTGGIMISVGTTTQATGVTANKAGVWLSGGVTVSGTTTVTDGNWHHIEVTRSGSTVRFFTDGNLEGTGTSATALSQNALEYIGSDGTGNYFNGNIDELRVSKAVARHTAAFTPPAAAYTVPGGIDSNTLCLLHFDGANNSTTITDSSFTAGTMTVGGNACIKTDQSMFGGASSYYDGAGDYVRGAGLSALTLTGDFTVEFWIRPNVAPGTARYVWDFAGGNGSAYIETTGVLKLNFGGTTPITGTTSLTSGVWRHIAIVRSAGVIKLYVNGVNEGSSYSSSATITPSANAPILGIYNDLTSYPFLGWIDEFRISNVARWTTNFTPYNQAYFLDASGSSNYVYDSVNDWFTPSVTLDQTAAGPASGSSAAANYTVFNYSLPVTNGKTITAMVMNQTVAGAYTLKIAQRTAAGSYTVVYSQAITHGGGGAQTFTLTTPYTVPSSGVYVLGAYTAISSALALATTTGRGYKTGDAALGANTGFTEDTSLAYAISAIYSYTPDNMTLLSIVYTAAAVPGTARVALQLADSLTLTPGTDFTVEVSRDGGTTWTAVTMALTMPLFGGVKIYEGTATISGQPSGTSMQWRLKTLSNKAIIASGVVLQQS